MRVARKVIKTDVLFMLNECWSITGVTQNNNAPANDSSTPTQVTLGYHSTVEPSPTPMPKQLTPNAILSGVFKVKSNTDGIATLMLFDRDGSEIKGVECIAASSDLTDFSATQKARLTPDALTRYAK